MKAKDIQIGKKVIWRTWAGDKGIEVTITSEAQKICGLWSCWINKSMESVPISYLTEK